ncbi:MAG TPA: iron-sulfur cluster assembly scaffold protein [Geminicoccaceae bacterium]|jgi:nitrogen fixation NifU-like protein|nr:iron-sulfur cluster assembly scaffold protein [Geminicoccaceae bacterium]
MAGNLYNDAIIAEAKAGHGHGRLPEPATSVTCDNPLCGDRVTIDLSPLADGRIAELAQRTRGCLLTQAAASVIGRHAAGATPAQVSEAADGLRRLLAGEPADPSWPELAMFAPVSAVKSRHECVLLPFDALAEALRQSGSA